MKIKILFSFLVFIFYVCTGSLYSQNMPKGTLLGRVISNEDMKALPYSTIRVTGTNNGAASDLNGNYIIRNINVGKQTISVSFIGYQTKSIDVVIKPDALNRLDVALKISTVNGEEVVVTAQRIGQQNAINDQINSDAIKNVVSADRLQENPDANIAEALGRLPGLSLIRSGGEGVAIVIRGLSSQYSVVTLNGMTLPSTSYGDRSTSISGISQYVLEGAEVFKSITADMDGNSVAGTINLTLAPAPDTLHTSILAQSGYNRLNDYWGNYLFKTDFSDRYFDHQLGVRLSFDAERNNRSAQTMSGTYAVLTNYYNGLKYEPVYLTSTSLNDIKSIKEKQAATLVLDWNFSPTSKILLYNLFSSEGNDYTSFSKQYVPASALISYNLAQNKSGKNLLYSGFLKGEHSLDWFDVDYGVSLSQTHSYIPNQRTWQFTLSNAFDEKYRNLQTQMLTPSQVIALSNDNSNVETLRQMQLVALGNNQNDLLQRDITLDFNLKVPFLLGDDISGYFKGGVKYKDIDRAVSFYTSNQYPSVQFGVLAKESLNWVDASGVRLNAVPFVGGTVSNFLGGQYNFGWSPNVDRLNQLWNWWNDFSNNLIAQGPAAVLAGVGQYNQIGFVPDFYSSSINNQNIKEKYFGTYLRAEINYSNLITFLPGVRYEKVTDDMIGNFVYDLSQAYTLNFPRTYQNAQHHDEFFLPMVSVKIRPLDWLHVMFSYTKTLGRPNFNAIVPNTFVHNTLIPYTYQAGNPELRPEQWTSYDLQMAIYNSEIGLFSVNGFFKQAKDKIWNRTYTRLKGDPIIPGFSDKDQVIVTQSVNNQNFTYLKGLEFEWQTSFWYLPSPLNYFTLNLNYTLIKTEARYPTTRLFTTYVLNAQGRPVPTLNRVDSVVIGRMLNQPDNIVNISLGFNYKGLNVWLSYQFNGSTITNWSTQPEMIGTRNRFQMVDLQVAQELPLKGLSLQFNLANINNEQQDSKLQSDPRLTYSESYGWTSGLGIRYGF